MSISKQQHQQQQQSVVVSNREIKHRILTCLGKLADRDTHSSASAELESIARTLSHDIIPPFLSSISATDAADKSPVRKQCVRLISLLSEVHGDALAPYLSKLLSAVVRRLRDPDSSVRSACVAAFTSISSHIVKPPFSSIIKPLVDALVTEQDHNSQISAALCLAAAIDASPDPDPVYLKRLLPRFEKLLKSESFKAKPALLTLVGSVIGSGAASTQQMLKNLVPCLVGFISSDDWAARKGAAEALVKLAVVQSEMLAEFKSPALKKFETRRYDKVKAVRDTMNQLIEIWKEMIPDGADEASPFAEKHSSSKGSPVSSITSGTPQLGRSNLLNRQPVLDASIVTTARKRSPVDTSDKKEGPAMFRKLSDRKAESSTPPASGNRRVGRYEIGTGKDSKKQSSIIKPEVRRALFNKKTNDAEMLISGATGAGPIVISESDEIVESTVVISNNNECEDVTLIRKQLVQIENQQSNLMDLLQRFIGSSENGMRSLENRVHGLELSIEEISIDLAMSAGRMSKIESKRTMCFKLPGAEFLSSKFWRRREGQQQHSTSRSTPSAVAQQKAVGLRNNSRSNMETFNQEGRGFHTQGGGGFIVKNPLALVATSQLSHGISDIASN
ncbi:TORTIFOLIA1-like protein 3 [Impatiens glandulifera]|uniref:TORTIFOLIA1-like protein 3 n=1 Tax=Impatiens glandulifera TaxID=253017 RepID=UPI001FB15337|nr:TORTIFOLIA1-like protein 3 [Impatiens glandulifera]